ncbi:MAG: 5-formyltetrahydrofolate cyclo-ligase, partial [bacterium]
MTSNFDKADLRATALARRGNIDDRERFTRSMQIQHRVTELAAFRAAQTICCYSAFRDEVLTDKLHGFILCQQRQLVLPRTHADTHTLSLHLVASAFDITPGYHGIPEPRADLPQLFPCEIDLFIVPGAAFDACGNRLGYGAGYYDGMLGESEAVRVGVAFACQLEQHIPAEEHDIPMDYLVTEHGTIDCAQARNPIDHLHLTNMVVYGHHGAFPHEREQGLRIAFDIDLRVDLQLAGITDNLSHTVNYPMIYQLIEKVQRQQQYHLLETLAARVTEAILQNHPTVAEVILK